VVAERRDSPRAWFHSRRGLSLYERGDVDGAERELRRADELGGAWGAFRLGFLLQERGDVAGAETAYRRAVGRGSANAANNLAVMLHRRGDLAEALDLYRRAAEWGDDSSRAARVLLESRLAGPGPGGQGAAPGGAPAAAQARLEHGVLLAGRGDVDGALAAYEAVIESGEPEQVPWAWFNIGTLRQQTGELAAASEAYVTAMASRHPHAAPKAAVNLGVVRSALGDRAGAEEAFGLAIRSAHPEQAPLAARNLAALHTLHGEDAEAARLLAQADAVDAAPRRTDFEAAQGHYTAARELRGQSEEAQREGREVAEVRQLAETALAQATAAFAAFERAGGSGVTVPEIMEEVCLCTVRLEDVTTGAPDPGTSRVVAARLQELADAGTLGPEGRNLLTRLTREPDGGPGTAG
jgi:tetratricopeptide (TPR) repeat protein